MSAIAMLGLLIALLLAFVGLAVAGGLGYLAYRRPVLAQPVSIAITATSVLAPLVIDIVQAVMP